MLQRRSFTIARGHVATSKLARCGTRLSMTCFKRDHTRDMALVSPCKDLVLWGWGNIGPRNREVRLDGQKIGRTGKKASGILQSIAGRKVRSRQRERRAHKGPR